MFGCQMCQGITFDMLNLSQGYKTVPQGQGCMAHFSNSTLQLTIDHEPVCVWCILFRINSCIINMHRAFYLNRTTICTSDLKSSCLRQIGRKSLISRSPNAAHLLSINCHLMKTLHDDSLEYVSGFCCRQRTKVYHTCLTLGVNLLKLSLITYTCERHLFNQCSHVRENLKKKWSYAWW